jgi:2-polyprenyl-6-methoxyphenol hydroxylase-like FAD-dependent oxidoreductase
MFGKKKPEVLVVGAGPVGLFTALLLAQRGVAVQIIDKEWRTGAHSYALALHGASLRLFQELGLLEQVLAQTYQVDRLGLYDDAQRRVEWPLPARADGLPALVVMPQASLERVLEEALAQRGVRVLWNHAVARLVAHADRVAVTVDKLVKESLGYAVQHTEWLVASSTDVEVPFVIGADGHRSQVRRALDIDYAETGPAQHFAVFEFKSEVDLRHELRLVLAEHTTNAVWPLPDGFCRWSFQLPEVSVPLGPRQKERAAVHIGAAHYPLLAEDHLRRLLAERAPWFQARIDEIKWRMIVRFERRLAAAFGRERVWLAGDAGHMTGPVGMQSMNVGFREARDLVAAVSSVLRQGAPAEPLAEYHRQRTAEWRFLLGLDGGLQPGANADPWLAARADRLLACLPASGPELSAALQRLGLRG